MALKLSLMVAYRPGSLNDHVQYPLLLVSVVFALLICLWGVCLFDAMAACLPFSHDQLCTLSGVHEFPISIAAPDNSRIEAQGSLQGPGITLRRVRGGVAQHWGQGDQCTDSPQARIVTDWFMPPPHRRLPLAPAPGTLPSDWAAPLRPPPSPSDCPPLPPCRWLPLAPAPRISRCSSCRMHPATHNT